MNFLRNAFVCSRDGICGGLHKTLQEKEPLSKKHHHARMLYEEGPPSPPPIPRMLHEEGSPPIPRVIKLLPRPLQSRRECRSDSEEDEDSLLGLAFVEDPSSPEPIANDLFLEVEEEEEEELNGNLDTLRLFVSTLGPNHCYDHEYVPFAGDTYDEEHDGSSYSSLGLHRASLFLVDRRVDSSSNGNKAAQAVISSVPKKKGHKKEPSQGTLVTASTCAMSFDDSHGH